MKNLKKSGSLKLFYCCEFVSIFVLLQTFVLLCLTDCRPGKFETGADRRSGERQAPAPEAHGAHRGDKRKHVERRAPLPPQRHVREGEGRGRTPQGRPGPAAEREHENPGGAQG
jgi:hypothetical protein